MTDEAGDRSQEDSGDRAAKPRKAVVRPTNWQEPVILLMLRQWNSYGYEMMERMTEFGLETMNTGTLYRSLRNMEKNGAVKSTWETSEGGPARRVYSITNFGEAYLDFWARSLEQYQRNLDTFFRLYTGSRQQRAGEKKSE